MWDIERHNETECVLWGVMEWNVFEQRQRQRSNSYLTCHYKSAGWL